MRILFVATEGSPFAKSGGLGDVIGSLPYALNKQNIEVRVILPKYESMPSYYKEQLKKKFDMTVNLGWRNQYCGVEELEYKGIHYYFIDNEYYFKRPDHYGYYDDGERFAFFNHAVLKVLPQLDYCPQIIHAHDWHTGMLSVFLKAHYAHIPFYKDMKTVFTIHNLKYQGLFPRNILEDLLHLSSDYFTADKLEFYGQINFMKAGLVYSDLITTVSKTYAQEIKYPFFGEKLDPVLNARKESLYGIVNGIDDKNYNPRTDQAIDVNYAESREKKTENKLKLQQALGLPVRKDVPMLAMITRLVEQKGVDLLIHIFEKLMKEDIQFVLLGTGESYYENYFKHIMAKYSRKVGVNILFDENMSRQIYAGSDIFLMPSRFEPCGLSQLIALRYGTIPIVRETGGLKDTVLSYNESTGEGNGFSFANYNAHDFLYTIRRALNIYKNSKVWHEIFLNALRSDFSWEHSSKEYLKLYQNLINESRT